MPAESKAWSKSVVPYHSTDAATPAVCLGCQGDLQHAEIAQCMTWPDVQNENPIQYY